MNNVASLEAVFFEALEKGSLEERASFLDEACAGDTDLRRRVEKMLSAQANAGSFLETPAAQVATTIDMPREIAEGPGMVIGPYKLLEQIGEGGFGVVFMAEQQRPVRRKVALKILKPGMDTHQVVARFEAERQALAIMDHPHIAKVFDGGATPSGRPYFVMEQVRGVPITDFCDENHLAPRERLELFVSVCQAVQHAHHKGIIHRDLKPSNVMVTVHDEKPVPKVIDFGVAKALGQQLTDKTLFTGFPMMIGTPLYMSPEQFGQSGVDIDTRSDIYSLGVLLYELLTGTTPFDKKRFKHAAFEEIRQIIREEEPPKPSTRLSELSSQHAPQPDAATRQGSTTLDAVAALRHTEPGKLRTLVRGELDWIVMKSLEKDRNRRYESASAFAADVQRYLNDEPVLACPPSAVYRLRKFARRNQRVLATVTLLGVMALVAVFALVVSYVRTNEALGHTTQARNQLDEALKRERQTNEDLGRTAYIQRIALAGRELAAGNVGRAEELLEECGPDRRGWEWHFLKRQRYGNPPPMQHPATVVRVVFSPDGRQIATVCIDGTVAIRDSRTGQVAHRLEQQTVLLGGSLVRGTAYSRDGRYLAVARHDGKIRVWDPATGQVLKTLEGHRGPSWQVAFSPDSRTLVSGGSDRSVRLWDVASGGPLGVFSEHPSAVKGVAFRPDGRSVVAACDDGTVKVWDRETGRETFSFHDELLAYPYNAWFSRDARRLAWACLDGTIKVWDTTTGRLEIEQQSNTHQCRATAFSPDGRRIALAGFDGTVRLLDGVTGRELLTIFAHNSLVADVAFAPDGHQLASASYDHTVRLWDAAPLTSDPLAPHCVTLTGHKDKVSGVAFSRDGRWLASASWDHTVKLWELSRGGEWASAVSGPSVTPSPGAINLRHTLRGHRGIVMGVAFSPDSRSLASASWDSTVKVWDLQAPRGDSLTERVSIPFTQRVASIAFSPDGKLLAMGQENRIGLYDPATGQQVYPFKGTPAPVPGLAFHPDRPILVSAGASDPAVKIWDVAAEKYRFEIRHYSNPNGSVAVDSNGRRIASPGRDQAGGDHTVKVWDVDWDAKTYTVFRTLRGHRGYVWKVTFSPDGRYLASGSWDSTVKVWDLEAPESAEPVTLRGHAGFIQSLAFSPDGRCLASASGYAGHGEVKVWDASLWENLASEGR